VKSDDASTDGATFSPARSGEQHSLGVVHRRGEISARRADHYYDDSATMSQDSEAAAARQ
jgi:hypothetical protein